MRNLPIDKVSKELSPIHEFTSPLSGLFSDPVKARDVLQAAARFLHKNTSENGEENSKILFAEIDIEFRDDIDRMQMIAKASTGKIMLIVPKDKSESNASLRIRETQILAEFSKTCGEAQMRSCLLFWSSLDKEAQQIFLKEFGDE